MEQQQYQSCDIAAKDVDKVRALLADAPPHEAVELREASANGLHGWWYGTYLEGELEAVAYIDPRTVYLYSKSAAPMSHLGNSLARGMGKRSGGGGHDLFGPDDVVLAFWQGFEISGKQVGANIKYGLYQLKAVACSQNEAYALRLATKKDLPLVFEFMAEALMDELGVDLRRVGKEAHERNCLSWLEAGQIWIGTHRGKPAYLLKYAKMGEAVSIEQAFFPVAMRRPKVMRGLLARTGELLLSDHAEVFYRIDVTKTETIEVASEVGFKLIGTQRMMRLR